MKNLQVTGSFTSPTIGAMHFKGSPMRNESDNDSSEDILLDNILQSELDQEQENFRAAVNSVSPAGPSSPDDAEKDKKAGENHTQWALGGNGRFSPVGSTTPRLPAGIYEPFATPGMWGVEKLTIASDGIYTLPDMATETVLAEVKMFWSNEARYRAHSLLYKRGIILYGPPGGGKTVTVKVLMNELVQRDGLVVIGQNINLTVMALKAIRRIEPGRNVIVVLEDIDEIINFNGESSVLSMLDGENNIDNVLHLATTNYPDKLGPRIINRPSRFDRRVEVGMPGDAARRAYLLKSTNDGIPPQELDKWVKDTHEMSIAHLRELVAAVYCLDQPYDEVIKRLQDMAAAVKGLEEFKRKGMGFANNKAR